MNPEETGWLTHDFWEILERQIERAVIRKGD
jgi:hypothetical protein